MYDLFKRDVVPVYNAAMKYEVYTAKHLAHENEADWIGPSFIGDVHTMPGVTCLQNQGFYVYGFDPSKDNRVLIHHVNSPLHGFISGRFLKVWGELW